MQEARKCKLEQKGKQENQSQSRSQENSSFNRRPETESFRELKQEARELELELKSASTLPGATHWPFGWDCHSL